MQPSAYEQQVVREIADWKQPSTGFMAKVRGRMSDAWSSATDLAKKVPGVEWTIDNIVTGLLDLTNEISHDSVWQDGILKEYARYGTPVATLNDIKQLDLEAVDSATNGLRAKYVSLAGAEGAATGFAGFAGIVPDIVALVALNLRAAGEYATYCGFDIKTQQERLYALQILDYVASSSDTAKELAVEPAYRVVKKVATSTGVSAIEQMGFNEAVERIARAIGMNLTGRKLSQVVPVAGAAVGAGLNVLYTRKVCDAAFHLYRERFLVEKYGPEVLAA
ncbi:MAG: EcsC family protein [Rhodothermales bacterium]|nr:EcsC family protein [Rhodothermales bacterium]MBO6778012.1 EcsC family protein [Rhodothermales bacterium]